jgi:hypothetical protein
MARYDKETQQLVKEEVHKYKEEKFESGKKGHKIKSRKQAIAIGLSKARRKGAKVPPRQLKTLK